VRKNGYTLVEVLIVILIIGIIFAILIPAINKATNEARAKEAKEVVEPTTINPVDLGNGIYRFDFTYSIANTDNSKLWQHSLVKFKKDRPNLTIISIAPAEQFDYGAWCKILVITEPKPER
jgi:prepilin-type N-terminal cleavage/methylation domain-containing protein